MIGRTNICSEIVWEATIDGRRVFCETATTTSFSYRPTIRYDTIVEFNVDSKAEYSA